MNRYLSTNIRLSMRGKIMNWNNTARPTRRTLSAGMPSTTPSGTITAIIVSAATPQNRSLPSSELLTKGCFSPYLPLLNIKKSALGVSPGTGSCDLSSSQSPRGGGGPPLPLVLVAKCALSCAPFLHGLVKDAPLQLARSFPVALAQAAVPIRAALTVRAFCLILPGHRTGAAADAVQLERLPVGADIAVMFLTTIVQSHWVLCQQRQLGPKLQGLGEPQN